MAGARYGEIGLVDTVQLLSCKTLDDAASCSAGTIQPSSISSVGGKTSHLRYNSPTIASAMASCTAGPVVETALNGEAIVRGFAQAMDNFEDSLKNAAGDAELGSRSGTREEAKGCRDVTVSTVMGRPGANALTADDCGPIFRCVVRGIGPVGQGQGQDVRGKSGRGAMTCLSLCARKPLLAGIVRTRIEADPVHYLGRRSFGSISAAVVASSQHGKSSGSTNSHNEEEDDKIFSSSQHDLCVPADCAEVQVWNYRTKRILLRYQFGNCSSGSEANSGGGGRGGGGGDTGGAETGGGGAEEGNGATPVAISLHPSGDVVAVAFPHYISIFYIVGGGGDREDGGGGSEMMVSSPTSSSCIAPAAQPLATLRSDQREFLTKGMFSVAGEKEAVINYDAVSALHYSPGGHLLAVLTGKVKC